MPKTKPGAWFCGGKHERMRTWRPEEDRLANELRKRLGSSSWTHIAQLLTEAGFERNAASVRNHFLRKNPDRKYPTKSRVNKCSLCGQVKRFHVCTAVTTVRQEDLPHAPPRSHGPPTVRPENLQGGATQGNVARYPPMRSVSDKDMARANQVSGHSFTLATSLIASQAMQPPEPASPLAEPASATCVDRAPRRPPLAPAAPCVPPPQLARPSGNWIGALPAFVHAGTSAFAVVRPVAAVG